MELLFRYNRKIHRFVACATGIPILLILLSGILLQLKSWIPWIQPPSVKGSTLHSSLTLQQILDASKTYSPAHIQSWKDIRAIDLRPSQGIARVRTQSEHEISIDLGTGKVLQAAPRRTSLLIELHEGSLFGKGVRLGIFLPAALLNLVLWGTGITMLRGRKK